MSKCHIKWEKITQNGKNINQMTKNNIIIGGKYPKNLGTIFQIHQNSYEFKQFYGV